MSQEEIDRQAVHAEIAQLRQELASKDPTKMDPDFVKLLKVLHISNPTEAPTPVTAAYDSMIQDVVGQMHSVFGTSNPTTANANYETYKVMTETPALFSSEGLVAEIEVKDSLGVILFNKGDALDTDQKVVDYASRLVVLIKDYGVYRMKRKKQFKDEIEGL